MTELKPFRVKIQKAMHKNFPSVVMPQIIKKHFRSLLDNDSVQRELYTTYTINS